MNIPKLRIAVPSGSVTRYWDAMPPPVRWALAADALAAVSHAAVHGLATFWFPLLAVTVAGAVWWARHRDAPFHLDWWLGGGAWLLVAAHVGPLAWDLVLQVVLWGAVAAWMHGRHRVATLLEHWNATPATLTAEQVPAGEPAAPAAEEVDDGPGFLSPAMPAEPPPSAPARAPGTAAFRIGGTLRATAADAERTQVILGAVLEEFGVDARMAGYDRGPATACHYIELGPRVLVSAVTKLGRNFALATGCQNLEILAVVPGRSAVGIVVPNADRDAVLLGDILASSAARALGSHPLAAGLGRDTAGAETLIDLTKLPHILIGGTTGSGKTVTVHDIVASVLSHDSAITPPVGVMSRNSHVSCSREWGSVSSVIGARSTSLSGV